MKGSNIALVGLKSCGKSTLGPIIAEQLGYHFVDTDQLIEKYYADTTQKKLSFSEIYQAIGNLEFRHLENTVLQLQLQDARETIISTGGGTLLNPQNRERLKSSAIIVYLKLSQALLYKRWQKQPPGFADKHHLRACFDQYWAQREDLLADYANITIHCDNKLPEVLSHEIGSAFRGYKPSNDHL